VDSPTLLENCTKNLAGARCLLISIVPVLLNVEKSEIEFSITEENTFGFSSRLNMKLSFGTIYSPIKLRKGIEIGMIENESRTCPLHPTHECRNISAGLDQIVLTRDYLAYLSSADFRDAVRWTGLCPQGSRWQRQREIICDTSSIPFPSLIPT
jgi:hypothetical protein